MNAGVRVSGSAGHVAPRETAAVVPPSAARMPDCRPGRPRVIDRCDVLVDAGGVRYVTDQNAGRDVLRYEDA